jgi:hypothetical protein
VSEDGPLEERVLAVYAADIKQWTALMRGTRTLESFNRVVFTVIGYIECLSKFEPDARVPEDLWTALQGTYDVATELRSLEKYCVMVEKIGSLGHITQQGYNALRIPEVITYLVELSRKQPSKGSVSVKKDLLMATDILLNVPITPPAKLDAQMVEAGDAMVRELLQVDMNDTAGKVAERLSNLQNGAMGPIDGLITANYRSGSFGLAIEHFETLLPLRNNISQDEYDQAMEYAMRSALEVTMFDKSEAIISISAQIAATKGLTLGGYWPMQLLLAYWKATRNLRGTLALFERLAERLEGFDAADTVYTAIMQVCAETGRDDLAVKYRAARLSMSTASSLRAMGKVALAKAARKDWEELSAILHKMEKDGQVCPKEYSSEFAQILRVFAKGNTLPATEDFVQKHYIEPSFRLNQRIAGIMVRACLAKKQTERAAYWLKHLSKSGGTLNSETFHKLLLQCHESWNTAFGSIIRLCREAKSCDSSFLCSQTRFTLLSIAAKIARGRSAVYEALRKEVDSLGLPNSVVPHSLSKSMKNVLASGDPKKCLEMYKSSISSGGQPTVDMLKTAVEASAQLAKHTNFDEALELIDEAKKFDINTESAVAVLLLMHLRRLPRRLPEHFTFLNSIADELPDHRRHTIMNYATQATSIFVAERQYADAVELWTEYARKAGLPASRITLQDLTILLRAYVRMSNEQGVEWVFKVMSENNIVPDRYFSKVVKSELFKLRKGSEEGSAESDLERLLVRSLHLQKLRVKENCEARPEVEDLLLGIVEDASRSHKRSQAPNPTESEHPFVRRQSFRLFRPTQSSPGSEAATTIIANVPLDGGGMHEKMPVSPAQHEWRLPKMRNLDDIKPQYRVIVEDIPSVRPRAATLLATE